MFKNLCVLCVVIYLLVWGYGRAKLYFDPPKVVFEEPANEPASRIVVVEDGRDVVAWERE